MPAEWPTHPQANRSSMHPAERPYDALAGRREQLRDRGQAARARAAGGLDERAGGGAETGARNRIAEQSDDDAFQLAARLHLDRGAVLEERPRDLRKVL